MNIKTDQGKSIAVVLAITLFAVACNCDGENPPGPQSDVTATARMVAPCAGGSCETRDISGFAPFASRMGGVAAFELPPADHTAPR